MKVLELSEREFRDILQEVQERGYYFSDCLNPEVNEALLGELSTLDLLYEDHSKIPLNKDKDYKVYQSHKRLYTKLGDERTPVATKVCYELAEAGERQLGVFPELKGWLLDEIGYQVYLKGDFISPHRDRWSDKNLSMTFTLKGENLVKIHESYSDPPDYQNLYQIDEYITKPRTVMFLRAPGFGSGKQMIHEVLPPRSEERYILNLRMRSTLLPAPLKISP